MHTEHCVHSSSLCSVCESLEFQFMSEVVVLCTQNTVCESLEFQFMSEGVVLCTQNTVHKSHIFTALSYHCWPCPMKFC